MNEENVNYERLIAAQNESARRYKITRIQNTIDEEKRRKNISAIISGTCFVGAIATALASGIDAHEAIQLEIQSLSSFSALKDYLALFSPTFYASAALSAANFVNFIKHSRRYKDANNDMDAMNNNTPEMYMNDMEQREMGRSR